MKGDDGQPHPYTARLGLVFAYVSFLLAIVTIGAAIYILPLAFKVKLFLSAAALLLTSLFVFMAIIAHLAVTARPAEKKPGGGTKRDP